jgi:hypothetical protein
VPLAVSLASELELFVAAESSVVVPPPEPPEVATTITTIKATRPPRMYRFFLYQGRVALAYAFAALAAALGSTSAGGGVH